MSKNVLVISTSFRKNGNSDILADKFIKGAKESGNKVEKIYLADKEMGFCRGCLACQSTGKCVLKDDINEVVEKMNNVDVVVFATPVYYYEMSGQMKTFLDRTNPLFGGNYTFKEIYLLLTAADEDKTSIEGVVKGLEGWITCFERTKLSGVSFVGGVTEKGDILSLDEELDKAYEMGKLV